ncbi:MAG: MaoC family dehydratase N-terminal domain-containing protein [Aquabacterium sp.]
MTDTNQDLARLSEWIGRSETADDILQPTPLRALQATLDHPALPFSTGAALPPLWHWLYFLPLHRGSEIGEDGHAHRGGFLPPVPLPRRMWAGSRFEFMTPLRVGQAVQRRSTIEDVKAKDGRSGRLVFVTVRHEVHADGQAAPALREWHDIVYREAARPGDATPAPQAAPQGARWHRDWQPDEVLLFRYSALTFNGHRIHYDRAYVTAVEGYAGLVVHGPLIATLLLDLVRREAPDAEVASFRFRALRPTIDGRLMRVNGQRDGHALKLWAQDHEGWLTMDAEATLR